MNKKSKGNKRDVKVFQMLRTEGRACCGFDWNTTKDGSDYWRDVIASKKFYLLPNPAEQEANNEPATDLIGDIKDFPLHVVEAMLDEQEKQGNERDVSVFQKALHADRERGGFNWWETDEGAAYWIDVIVHKKFDLLPKPTEQEANIEPATATQVGDSHYKDMAIQPIEFILKNGLGFCEGNVIKYVCRHRSKNGKQDIEKAIHYLQLLIEKEYGK